MKQVLMIAYSLYPYDTRLKREAEALVRHGFQVTFLVLMEGIHPRTYESNGVTVVELRVRKYRGGRTRSYLISYIHFMLRAFVVCTARFFKGQVDIVHVHNMPDILVLAGIVPRLFGKKLILDIHDSIPETFEGKFKKPSPMLFAVFCLEEKLSCALAHRLICVNEIQKDTLVRRGIPSEKMTVIMNVPDPLIFGEQEINARRKSKPTFDLVYHGVIDQMIGLDLVLEAMSRMSKSMPNLNFHIIGMGPHLNALMTKAEELGIEQRVHFSRKVFPVEDIPAILERMDMGVVPNRRNGATELMLPVKLMEYAAVGLPCIAPSLRTIKHYFTDDMVSYFEPDNVESIMDAIARLYRDENKRIKQSVLAGKFLHRYGWEHHQNDLIEMYRNLG